MFVAVTSQLKEGYAFVELPSGTDATNAISELPTQPLNSGKVTIDSADNSGGDNLAGLERSFYRRKSKTGEGESMTSGSILCLWVRRMSDLRSS
jgi:hypothetical protein